MRKEMSASDVVHVYRADQSSQHMLNIQIVPSLHCKYLKPPPPIQYFENRVLSELDTDSPY